MIDPAIERLADGEVSRSSTTSPKQATRSSFARCLADTFSGRGPSNKPVLLIGAGSRVVPLMAVSRNRKASCEPVPVAVLLSSRTYKAAAAFSAPFRQLHRYVRAESDGNEQNSN